MVSRNEIRIQADWLEKKSSIAAQELGGSWGLAIYFNEDRPARIISSTKSRLLAMTVLKE